jgi:hypothetical protein
MTCTKIVGVPSRNKCSLWNVRTCSYGKGWLVVSLTYTNNAYMSYDREVSVFVWHSVLLIIRAAHCTKFKIRENKVFPEIRIVSFVYIFESYQFTLLYAPCYAIPCLYVPCLTRSTGDSVAKNTPNKKHRIVHHGEFRPHLGLQLVTLVIDIRQVCGTHRTK